MKEHEGWDSLFCTKSRCRKALDAGAGHQLRDDEDKDQRYCWKHWVEYNLDPKRFGIVKESS